jgi:hypothetical protein
MSYENIPTVRLHAGVLKDPGTESCDFRGSNFIGEDDGDHHRTVLELDRDGTLIVLDQKTKIELEEGEFDEIMAAVLAFGTKINTILSRASFDVPLVSGRASARVGVWDKTPPKTD